MARAILKTVLGGALAAAVLGMAPDAEAVQGFTGDFDPDRWELYNSSPQFTDTETEDVTVGGAPLAPFNGSVDVSGAPDFISLLGSDQSAILEQFGLSCTSTSLAVDFLFLCQSSFTAWFIPVGQDSILSFDWDYITTDSFGPAFDPFGYVIGTLPPDDPDTSGQFVELTDRSGSATQSGSAEVTVPADHIFAFQIGTADNQGGQASVTISNFYARPPAAAATVPEPGTNAGIAIAALGLGAFALRRRP